MVFQEDIDLACSRLREVNALVHDDELLILVCESDAVLGVADRGIVNPIIYANGSNENKREIFTKMKNALAPEKQTESGYVIFSHSLSAFLPFIIDPNDSVESRINVYVFSAVWQRMRANFQAKNGISNPPHDLMRRVGIFFSKPENDWTALAEFLKKNINEVVHQVFKDANKKIDNQKKAADIKLSVEREAEALFIGSLMRSLTLGSNIHDVCKFLKNEFVTWLYD